MISIAVIPLALVLSAADPQGLHDSHTSHGEPAAMKGALGAYPMSRDSSGTGWQPDSTPHAMGHTTRGDWTLMSHALLNGVYDWQDGPRGDEEAFLAGMVMGSARRELEAGDTLVSGAEPVSR